MIFLHNIPLCLNMFFQISTHGWNRWSIQKCFWHFLQSISCRFPLRQPFSEHLKILVSFLGLTSFGFGDSSHSPIRQWALKCSRQYVLPHLHCSGRKSVWLQFENSQFSPKVGNSIPKNIFLFQVKQIIHFKVQLSSISRDGWCILIAI